MDSCVTSSQSLLEHVDDHVSYGADSSITYAELSGHPRCLQQYQLVTAAPAADEPHSGRIHPGFRCQPLSLRHELGGSIATRRSDRALLRSCDASLVGCLTWADRPVSELEGGDDGGVVGAWFVAMVGGLVVHGGQRSAVRTVWTSGSRVGLTRRWLAKIGRSARRGRGRRGCGRFAAGAGGQQRREAPHAVAIAMVGARGSQGRASEEGGCRVSDP